MEFQPDAFISLVFFGGFIKSVAKAVKGAAGSILGGIAGSATSGLFSASQASTNREFQAEQSKTAYQRAVKDMRKAGLNPILAARLGGASTPPGAMGAIPDLGSMFSTALSTSAERQLVDEKENVLQKEMEWLAEQIHMQHWQRELLEAQVAEIAARISKMGVEERTEETRLWVETQLRELWESAGLETEGAAGQTLSSWIGKIIPVLIRR